MAQTSEQNVTESATEQFPPAIAAAFLVTFDNRKGYTIAWQNAIDDVKLDGVVEFKSLPSGLHNVEEDLVYFVHDNYAGISAFLRKDDEQAARNARMLSVGVLVPIEAGRMGKSFLYARELRDLARNLIDDQATITPLEKFWDKHKKAQVDEQHDTQEPEPREKYQKLRTLSTTTLTTPTPNRCLPPHHPALALPDLLHAFGPLIFPVFRAALLRKRILIIGEAPVEPICDFVYCLSILSSISRTDAAQIPESDVSKFRTRPLFTIGIPDIPMLEKVDYPWIACTTDDVLASKPHLFDVLVIMPNSPVSQKYSSRTYPKVISSSPELTKEFPHHGQRATRRDARRFSALKAALARIPRGSSRVDTEQRQDDSDSMSTNSSVSTIADSRETVEPTPWSVIAYTSLIWWASAGDRRSGLMEAEELANEQDESLLREALSEEGTTKEVAMVVYFHKLTSMVFSALGNAARRNGGDEQERYRDDDSDESEAEDRALLSSKDDDNQIPVEVTAEDVRAMGLDVWSAMDQKFVQEMIQTYWHRPAVVQGGIIECCGIRLL